MLGWHITVIDEHETWLGAWDVGPWGADWLLVEGIKTGDTQTVKLNGGYPNVYKARARILPLDKLTYEATTSWVDVIVWDNS